MTDETTRLRDALLDDITYPARFDALPPDRCGDLAARLDALIAAAAAEARAGLVGVEAVREAAHWLERSQREQNVHQFRHGMALLRAALAGPTPSPAVERRGRLSHGGGQHHPGQHPRGAGSSMHDVGGPHVLDLLNEAARPGQSFSFQIPTTDFTKDG